MKLQDAKCQSFTDYGIGFSTNLLLKEQIQKYTLMTTHSDGYWRFLLENDDANNVSACLLITLQCCTCMDYFTKDKLFIFPSFVDSD